MSSPAVDKLISYFREQQIAFVEPASETELKKFESKYNVRLPSDFRQYLSLGHPAQWDTELVDFYGLSKLEIQSSSLSADIFCVFADYSINCWSYSLKLPRGDDQQTPVFVDHGDIHLDYRNKIANSFSEFIDRYLKEGLIIYDVSPMVKVGDTVILKSSDHWGLIKNDGLPPEKGVQYLVYVKESTRPIIRDEMNARLKAPLITWAPINLPSDMKEGISQVSLQVLSWLSEIQGDSPYKRTESPVFIEGVSCRIADRPGWRFLAFIPGPISKDYDEETIGLRARRYRRYFCLPYKGGVLILMDELAVGKEPAIQAEPEEPMKAILDALEL